MFGKSMQFDYESRKVGRYEKDGVFVSTVLVYDGGKPYETAVSHPLYNNDKIIIVECYDSIDEAEKGHQKWIEIMTSNNTPDEIIECLNSEISLLADVFGKNKIHKRAKVTSCEPLDVIHIPEVTK